MNRGEAGERRCALVPKDVFKQNSEKNETKKSTNGFSKRFNKLGNKMQVKKNSLGANKFQTRKKGDE